MENLEIKTVNDEIGRGVFAKRDFELKEIIEKCHMIPLPEKDHELLKDTKLKDYYY